MGLHRAAVDGTTSDELRRLAVPGGGLATVVTAIAESEPGIVIHWVDAAVERRAWTIGEVLTTLRLAFGGARAYLGTAGVGTAQVDAIRAKLLG